MRDVKKAGDETVNGVPTTHYRGKLDHETLKLRMAKDKSTSLDTLRDGLGSDIPVTAEAWIDKDGHIVRTRLDSSMAGTKNTVTMTLSEIDKPVQTPAVPQGAPAVAPAEVGGPLTG
ncbi:LppX_LprAFG lipoprotein (plasmid) [Streptomyces sp. HU2014]|uniref:LppX_LprAFG lipoprotein n=1 Tax=Streptomyces sp. HU2014 TaxID=2939414 RepID=UPI00200CF510|nr:LppX_LprAFG lipoprotein [Streptomyces sp. HU2014]UQI49758.1 LppX_LprAFG lipoprotein [Streptomyces sp. HU2014]